MAIEEISLYTVNGEEITVSNLVNQMINYYQLKQEVGETQITDFREGSEIRNLLEAFAIGIYALLDEETENTKIAFLETSYGGWLDRIGQLPFINVEREFGSNATGMVTFTLGTAQEEDFYIDSNTLLSSSSTGLDFETTSACIIEAGSLTGSATVECITTGYDGNVLSGSIDTIEDDILDTELVSVTNTERLEGGADYEEDDDYRLRIYESVQADGFGTIGYYQNLCESVEGVHDVLLVDSVDYTKKILVNGYENTVSDSVLLQVLEKVTDTKNIVLGHNFTVDSAGVTVVDLNISLNVLNTIDAELIKNVLRLYVLGGEDYEFEFGGLSINDNLTRLGLEGVLVTFADVVEVTSITSNGEEVSTISPPLNNVLKLGTITISQTEV